MMLGVVESITVTFYGRMGAGGFFGVLLLTLAFMPTGILGGSSAVGVFLVVAALVGAALFARCGCAVRVSVCG